MLPLMFLENWQVSVPAELADAPFVVLANMAPINQLQMLEQCNAQKKFVWSLTRWDLWITVASEELHDVLKRIDLLVINESEAREFADTNNLVLAGERLLGKGTSLRCGEAWRVWGQNYLAPMEHFLAVELGPLRDLSDPTGAGDTFLGGLIGTLAAEEAVTPTFDQLENGSRQRFNSRVVHLRKFLNKIARID